jgi:hypothetical protein
MLEESVIQVMCVSAASIALLLSVPNGLLLKDTVSQSSVTIVMVCSFDFAVAVS